MAYPTIEAPYGLHAVNLLGGQPYAGVVRHMPIANGYDTNIGYGEPVKRIADGTIAVAGAADKPIGVFMGCVYTNPTTKQPTYSQMWPADTAAADAQAYVVDDPDALFKAAVVSGDNATIDGLALSAVGKNASLGNLAKANEATGNSAAGVNAATSAVTATLPIRVVDVVAESAFDDSGTTKYREVIVRINLHQYNTALGV